MARKKRIRARSIAREFDSYFGTGKLHDWQRLCRDVGLTGTYSSITKCRKALKTVHVNIHDLVDAVKKGQKPQRFRNARELIEYTIATRKFFPKHEVKEMGPVRALLRVIL